MAAKKMRVGIVGCGGIARAHIGGYSNAGAQIVAVYDTVPEAASRAAEQTGAAAAGSLQEMIDAGVQAVSICTPPAVHHENAKPFLKAGIPILCEKPLSATGAQAARFAADVERSGVVFMTAFCHRFHPPVIALKRLIEKGTLGEPLLLRNIFGGYSDMSKNHRANPALSGGGCMIDHCCHSMDLFRFLVGDPTDVQAITANLMQDLPVEDFGMVQFGVNNKAFGEITGTYSLRGCGAWVQWFGTKGSAIISYWNPGQPELSYMTDKTKGWKTIDVAGKPERFTTEIKHFLACVRAKKTPGVTVADGVKANRMADAMYKAAKTGKRVKITL